MKNMFRIKFHPEAMEWLSRFEPILKGLTVEVKPRGGAPKLLCRFLGLDGTSDYADAVGVQPVNEHGDVIGDVRFLRVESITIL